MRLAKTLRKVHFSSALTKIYQSDSMHRAQVIAQTASVFDTDPCIARVNFLNARANVAAIRSEPAERETEQQAPGR